MKRALAFSILCGIAAAAFAGGAPARLAAQDTRINPALTITSVETTAAGDRLILRFDRRLRAPGTWQISAINEGTFPPFNPQVRITEVFPSNQFLELLFGSNTVPGGFGGAGRLIATTSPEGTDGSTLDPQQSISFVNGLIDASETRNAAIQSGDGTLGMFEGYVCNVAGTVVEISLREDSLAIEQFPPHTAGPRGGSQNSGIRVTVPPERRSLFFVGQEVTASGFTNTDPGSGMLTIDTGSDGLKAAAAGLGGPRAPITPTVKVTPDIEDNGEANESTAVTVRGGRFGLPARGSAFFEAGGRYRYTDSQGSMDVYVSPTATDIIGRPIPTGDVDVTGVVVQLDDTLPYTDSYALAPRSFADIGAALPSGWIFWE
jgi:hypothetical protein